VLSLVGQMLVVLSHPIPSLSEKWLQVKRSMMATALYHFMYVVVAVCYTESNSPHMLKYNAQISNSISESEMRSLDSRSSAEHLKNGLQKDNFMNWKNEKGTETTHRWGRGWRSGREQGRRRCPPTWSPGAHISMLSDTGQGPSRRAPVLAHAARSIGSGSGTLSYAPVLASRALGDPSMDLVVATYTSFLVSIRTCSARSGLVRNRIIL
jgi:hypothetical protein